MRLTIPFGLLDGTYPYSFYKEVPLPAPALRFHLLTVHLSGEKKAPNWLITQAHLKARIPGKAR